MATIQRFFNETVSIRRYIGGQYRSYSTVTASQETYLERDTSPPTIDRYGVDSNIYTAYMDIDADIKHSDLVTGTDGLLYKVIGVVKQGEDTAMNEHKEVSLRQFTK